MQLLAKLSESLFILDNYKETEDFETFKSKLNQKLNYYENKVLAIFGEYELMRFEDFIEEIKGCEDVEEFDGVWEYFYDWADDNKIWIKTF